MKIGNSNGIHIQAGKSVFFDPSRAFKEGIGIVSHAHSDHSRMKKGHENMFMTKQTRELIESNSGVVHKAKELEFGEKFKFSGSEELSLHSAGHILGSSQLLIEGESTIAITSDFKSEDSLTMKGAPVLEAETLVMETTFGLPEFSFPKRETVYNEMATWAKHELEKNHYIVLSGYATGKAQDLTAFCNHCLGIAPIVHQKIYDNNLVYKKNKVPLGEFIKPTHNLNDSQILIVPPNLVSEYFLQAVSLSTGKKVSSAIATGWKGRNWIFNKSFPLSDHADFQGLCAYVKASGASRVYTYHGFSQEFASYASRRLGVIAKPIGKQGQSSLSEFI